MENLRERYLKKSSVKHRMEQQQLICISRKEYEGMKETIELLQDPEIMEQILESEQNIQAGKIKKFEF